MNKKRVSFGVLSANSSIFGVLMADVKFIDVERIIESKNPKLLKWLPRFIVRYLKRIIHQDEINAFLKEHKEKKNAAFCDEVIKYFNITTHVKHIERIPKNGKIVIAMNHPLGGMDAIILISALNNHRPDLRFIVNDILLSLENLSDLFVGVNKHGKNSPDTRKNIETVFKSDNAVCIFPAGLVSRKLKGEVRDLEWKKTFVTYSREHQRQIIPVHIEGKLSNFFYRLHKLRTFLGIKANIEMLYLSNELFKQRNAHIEFTVGEPIEESLLNHSGGDRKIAQLIKESVYALVKH